MGVQHYGDVPALTVYQSIDVSDDGTSAYADFLKMLLMWVETRPMLRLKSRKVGKTNKCAA